MLFPISIKYICKQCHYCIARSEMTIIPFRTFFVSKDRHSSTVICKGCNQVLAKLWDRPAGAINHSYFFSSNCLCGLCRDLELADIKAALPYLRIFVDEDRDFWSKNHRKKQYRDAPNQGGSG